MVCFKNGLFAMEQPKKEKTEALTGCYHYCVQTTTKSLESLDSSFSL